MWSDAQRPPGWSTFYDLTPHVATPARAVSRIRMALCREDDRLYIQTNIDCDPARVVLPHLGGRTRVDGLWKSTCLELFHTRQLSEYVEYNLNPWGSWAAYHFDEYRAGMRPFEIDADAPHCSFTNEVTWFNCGASVPYKERSAAQVALSAVIEETDGTKSYWALRHPPGAPDFHHPDCFALTLEAPGAA